MWCHKNHDQSNLRPHPGMMKTIAAEVVGWKFGKNGVVEL